MKIKFFFTPSSKAKSAFGTHCAIIISSNWNGFESMPCHWECGRLIESFLSITKRKELQSPNKYVHAIGVLSSAGSVNRNKRKPNQTQLIGNDITDWNRKPTCQNRKTGGFQNVLKKDRIMPILAEILTYYIFLSYNFSKKYIF